MVSFSRLFLFFFKLIFPHQNNIVHWHQAKVYQHDITTLWMMFNVISYYQIRIMTVYYRLWYNELHWYPTDVFNDIFRQICTLFRIFSWYQIQTDIQTFVEKQELETISRVANTSIMETKFKVQPVPANWLCVIENLSNWRNVNVDSRELFFTNMA